MTIKKYTIGWSGGEVVICVDLNVATEDMLHEINNFWCGSEERLAEADGDVLTAVINNLARVCFIILMKYDWNAYGLMMEFDYDEGGIEGWPRMDGSDGFLIQYSEPPEITPFDLDIAVEEIKDMPVAPVPNE